MRGDMHYKFLDAADVEKVLVDGTILVSGFEYFRRLEESEWGLIADRLEGAAELTIPSNFIATKDSPELNMLNDANIGQGMFKQFASVSGDGVISLSGLNIVHT